mmetsp:Transcript_11321/g.12442  ORF Transcript_11321/g.12442 Transcript_11321/m.12442 type:complete len:137 (-) Transcript_11321:241-651(-)
MSKVPHEEWKQGLCSCFDDCGICLVSFSNSQISIEGLAVELSSVTDAPVEGRSCIVAGCFSAICLSCLNRTYIRNQYGIDGNCISDLLISVICRPCAISQMYNESRARFIDEALEMQYYAKQNNGVNLGDSFAKQI